MLPICGAAPESPDTLALPAEVARAAAHGHSHPFSDSWTPDASEGLHLGLDRMLLSLPGVNAVRGGGLGSYMAFSLWGSGASQVDVYVDGMPVGHAADGLARLGDIDPGRVERIEVFKGASPSFLPGSPIGGVIHVITRSGLKGAGSRVSANLESYGGRQAAVELDGGNEHVHAFAHAGLNRAGNDYAYLGDQRLEYVPDGRGARSKTRLDLAERRLLHNGHNLVSGRLGLRTFAGDGQGLGVRLDVSRLDKEFPQVDADEDLDEGAARRSEVLSSRLSWWKRHATGSRSEAALDLRIHREEYDDRRDLLGIGVDWDRDYYGTAALGGRHERLLPAGWSGSLLAHMEAQAHQYEDRWAGVLNPPLYRYTGELKPSLWRELPMAGLLRLQAAMVLMREEYYRGVRYSAFGSRMDPRRDRMEFDGLASLRRELMPELALEAQAGSGHRLPTFLERFGDRGAVKGNPALEPERSHSLAAGLRYAGRGGHPFALQARLFHRRTRDAITATHNSQRIIVFENTDRTIATGEELSLEAGFRRLYRLQLAFTHQSHYAISSRPGDAYRNYTQLPFVPVWSLAFTHSVRMGILELKHLGYLRGLTFSNPSGSPSFYDPYADNREVQARHDLLLAARLGGKRNFALEASFSIENLLDAPLFDFYGSPLPSRTFAAALTARL